MRARSTAVRLLVPLLLVTAGVPLVAAQEVVFVVRHAERADGGHPAGMSSAPADPDLSTAGRARAERLAAMLKDAGIKHIYVTEFKRTQQTAAPLAAAARVEATIVPSKDVAGLVNQLKSADGPALVVGHSNSLPDILKTLGVSRKVHIGDDEYGDLFIVVRGGPEPVLVTLKF